MTIYYRIKKILKKPKIRFIILHLKSVTFFLNFIMVISTVAASIATCVTVLQMRNERNQSYKPYFVIESVDYMDEYTKQAYNFGDIRNLSDSLRIVESEERPPMYIIINNIGAGTATNINISFPDKVYKNYWEIACEYYKDEEIEITEHDLSIKKNMDNRIMWTGHHVYKGDFNVYETHVVSGENLSIKLPDEYQKSLRSIAYCTRGDCHRPPVLELVVNYEDLQGIHYTETYNIGVDVRVDTLSSEIIDCAKYIFKQCKPDLNMEDYYAGWYQ